MNKRVLGCFGMMLAFGAASLSADLIAYEDTNSNQFGTVDLNTGVFTAIATLSQENVGLAEVGGNLYTGGYNSGSLYEINSTSGAMSLVGSGSINYLDIGSTTDGIYAIGGQNAVGAPLSLFSINASTGAATLVGSTGLSISTSVVDTIGLSTGAAGLYFSFGPSYASDTFYTLDTATGAATAVGAIGEDAVSGSAFERGNLWALSNYNGTSTNPGLITVNTTTGAGTYATSLSGGAALGDGLAPFTAASAPEPGTWSLLLGGGIVAWFRRSRKN